MNEDAEDWDEGNIGTCDECKRENVKVIYTNDPFIAEIYPEDENPDSYWCRPCYRGRCDEI